MRIIGGRSGVGSVDLCWVFTGADRKAAEVAG